MFALALLRLDDGSRVRNLSDSNMRFGIYRAAGCPAHGGELMLQLVELVMISLDVSGSPPDKALSQLDPFSSARRTDFMLQSQNIEADLQEWKVAVEMQD